MQHSPLNGRQDKVKNDKRDIIPDFSDEIRERRGDSFFQTGFNIVHRLLFMFLLFFFFMLTMMVIFSCLFYVDLKVEGMGVLEPAQYQEVRSDLTATVEKIHVTHSAGVAKGDLLASLSEKEFYIQIAQAKSDLAAARAELRKRIEQQKLTASNIDTVQSYIKIRSQRNGIVRQLFVRKGQHVRKGQLLARLSDFEDRIQLYKNQKDLDVSKAELQRRIDKYELSYSIYKDLISELDKAETFDDIPEIAVQRAIVEKATSEVELLKDHIEKTNIRCPVDGQVLSANIEDLIGNSVLEGEVLMLIGAEEDLWPKSVGFLRNPHTIPEIEAQKAVIDSLTYQIALLEDQLKKTRLHSPIDGTIITPDLQRREGSLVTRGETLMMVAKLDKWVVKAVISEKDIPKLKLGDLARIKINAFPFMEFKMFDGRITCIDHISTSVVNQTLIANKDDNKKGSSPYFEITIQLDDDVAIKGNKRVDFQFGLLANVNIIVSSKRIISYLWELFLGKLDFFSNISMGKQAGEH